MKKKLLSILLATVLSFGCSVPVNAMESNADAVTEVTALAVVSQEGRSNIFVSATGLTDLCGADSCIESGGVSLLSYTSELKAEKAMDYYRKQGYEANMEPMMVADATNYVYTPDALGQYNKTVYESTRTHSMVLAPELMGLTYSARNIVDAQATTSIKPVGVAVIDSGVDASAYGLSGRVKGGYNVMNGGSNAHDENGHGTFIASEIANNTPSNVSIIPIKVTDATGSFTASRLAAALQYLVGNSAGVNVINLSLSICTLDSTQMDQVEAFINPYIDALYAKGIIVVTSAGNYLSAYPSMTADDSYPANYSKCIAVGALSYSNGSWGVYSQSLKGNCIDYWAPGKFIRGAKAATMSMSQASAANNWTGEWLDVGDGTCVMSGTSQATAFVTSALAHILSYDTYLTADEQMRLLRTNSTACSVGVYPEMSGYFYAVGAFNSATGGYSGVIADWDVVVDTAQGTVTLVKYTGLNENVTIPSTYTVNGRSLKTVLGTSSATSGPFSNNTKIKTVIISDGVSVKDNNAAYMFYGCKNLQSMSKIPSDVIDTSYMFYGCSGLLQFPVVPSKVVRMDYMFYGCSGASGVSKIESANVSSAKDAYTGVTAKIELPEKSTSYYVIEKLLSNWKTVTLVGGGAPATEQENTGNVVPDTANKQPQYNVTYYYRDVNINKVSGGKVVTIKCNASGYAEKPVSPTKTNYYFAGWYTKDGSALKKFSFEDTKVTSDLKLYAKWISKKIGATKITLLKKNGKSAIKVGYKKASNATHYQIYVSNHKNFQSGALIRTKNLKKTISVLYKSKKYVKVRGCRKLGGKWYYGKWSSVKTLNM